MIHFDTETCGLHGPIVLVQYAEDDGSIHLHDTWLKPVSDTLDLFEWLASNVVCGFNLSFDWFHVCQMYTTMLLLDKSKPPDIEEYAVVEERGRFGPCIKPAGALDLMIFARKGPYQSTMNRSDIRIKRVPTALAHDLSVELDKRVPLKDLYFARYKDPKRRWQVYDIHNDLGDMVPDLKDVVLKFAPSSALKALAQDALGVETVKFLDIEPPAYAKPVELGYAPFCTAIGTPDDWKGAWPEHIRTHIAHWEINEKAREYATDDVVYLQKLYMFFNQPKPNDDDSIATCMVGAARWRGFAIDIPRIQELRQLAEERVASVSFKFTSVEVCKTYLIEHMSETERLIVKGSTKASVLEEIEKWRVEEVCGACAGDGCKECVDGLIKTDKLHPAAERAREILDARHAKKEIETYDKLINAGRFHASLNVFGALSGRMSGGDGLNAHGIKASKEVRRCFPLADGDLTLSGGDFVSFEIGLMDAAYNDPKLREDLLRTHKCIECLGEGCNDCKGTGEDTYKIHGLFGESVFPGMSYFDILKTKGTGEGDKYSRAKRGVFAMAYGGNDYTLQDRVGIDEESAAKAYANWVKRYIVWGKEREKIFNMFCSMKQPGGLGTRVEWHEPEPFIESMYGLKRYFTLENSICEALFNLAEKPPKAWTNIKMRVTRRQDRGDQTVAGALRSAVFAAAFQVQAANMRAAANHVIQSSGASLTKMLQCEIWSLQPPGIHSWRVQPLNIHDEIMCPALPTLKNQLQDIVDSFVTKHKVRVPLLGIDWSSNLKTWADK